ncbi:hypothetical protein JYB87_11990 [Shewanella avicenniae]|uniref:Transcriptional regulator n=1 Tax=Shewanella avicenniae TaxID=2814294 RepID=A0ABX7QNF6_9GAMM|nr:hypothetical protein [Shewanella avicenniae]QSX32486.1 hypothetical protein JYB87_11990 [Shewanella avicenniae]
MGNTTSNKAAKNYAVLLSAICECGNSDAGEAIGKDAAFISRLKNGERSITLQDFATLLTAIGLELISQADQAVTIDKQLYESLGYLARRGLDVINQGNDA